MTGNLVFVYLIVLCQTFSFLYLSCLNKLIIIIIFTRPRINPDRDGAAAAGDRRDRPPGRVGVLEDADGEAALFVAANVAARGKLH